MAALSSTSSFGTLFSLPSLEEMNNLYKSLAETDKSLRNAIISLEEDSLINQYLTKVEGIANPKLVAYPALRTIMNLAIAKIQETINQPTAFESASSQPQVIPPTSIICTLIFYEMISRYKLSYDEAPIISFKATLATIQDDVESLQLMIQGNVISIEIQPIEVQEQEKFEYSKDLVVDLTQKKTEKLKSYTFPVVYGGFSVRYYGANKATQLEEEISIYQEIDMLISQMKYRKEIYEILKNSFIKSDFNSKLTYIIRSYLFG